VVRTDPVDAYAYCERLAQSHYENFPVASWLLPAAMRPPIAAIYAFARIADDMADEGARPPADRLADLERWGLTLDAALQGEFELSDPQSAVFIALADAIDRFDLPIDLFRDLLSAFRQDVVISRYPTWDALMDYCRRSANPVGRLVLRVAGYDDPALDAASDAVCTALQLTNFWQDLEIDWRKGRLYVPLEILTQYGAREADLSAGRLTPEWRAALADITGLTREQFAAGVPVCDGVSGRLRFELRATWLGGNRILDKLEAAGFDVFAKRPTLTRADAPLILWRTMRWDL
jgi:hydroxysqualene synthase